MATVDADAAPPGSPAQNVRDMTLKDIISGMKRRRGDLPMPSTVLRAAERRKRRRNGGSSAGDTVSVAEVPEAEREVEEDEAVVAPQVTMDEDGNIVIDQASLVVSAGSVTNAEAERGAVTTVENHAYANHITSSSYAKRESPQKWEAEETERFFTALSRFGSDFSLMESQFPGRTRRQLKLKFKRAERDNPERIDSALNGSSRPPLPTRPRVNPTVPDSNPTPTPLSAPAPVSIADSAPVPTSASTSAPALAPTSPAPPATSPPMGTPVSEPALVPSCSPISTGLRATAEVDGVMENMETELGQEKDTVGAETMPTADVTNPEDNADADANEAATLEKQ